jgi:hypothetical protein
MNQKKHKAKEEKGQRTFWFSGQSLITPNANENHDSRNIARCRGYKGYECEMYMDARLGVLEPRCPSCYKKHIEIEKNKS